MVRNKFDEQLQRLHAEMMAMGGMIERGIRAAGDLLQTRDLDRARDLISRDDEVDRKEREIEALCLRLILMQQPVARDLRVISAALKMITDMERIGDQASDISGIVIYLAGKPYIKSLEHLPQMAEASIRMVTGSLDAFINKDLALARDIIAMDDIIDDLFDTIKAELIDLIRHDPDNGEQAIDLLMIAKYFERIGDHAQNIAEWAEYSITGVHKGAEL